MDIKVKRKGKPLAINGDILTKIKMKSKRVWKLYFRTDTYLKEYWSDLWRVSKYLSRREYQSFSQYLSSCQYLSSSFGSPQISMAQTVHSTPLLPSFFSPCISISDNDDILIIYCYTINYCCNQWLKATINIYCSQFHGVKNMKAAWLRNPLSGSLMGM